jgi:CheY-like chemotaxis protein
MGQPLDRCRVLVVEDEAMIAMDLHGILRRAGCEVIGPVGRVEAATLRADDEPPPDIALLDINVGGESVFVVADALAARRIPFVFVTGYGKDVLPERFRERPMTTKPYSTGHLLTMLAEAVGRHGPAATAGDPGGSLAS